MEHRKQWLCSESNFQTSSATCACNILKSNKCVVSHAGSDIGQSLELLAFLPNPLFQVAIDELLRRLEAGGQTKAVEYLKHSKYPCALNTENDIWCVLAGQIALLV